MMELIKRYYVLVACFFMGNLLYPSELSLILKTTKSGNYTFQTVLYKDGTTKITGSYTDEQGVSHVIPIHMIQQPSPVISRSPFMSSNHIITRHPKFSK